MKSYRTFILALVVAVLLFIAFLFAVTKGGDSRSLFSDLRLGYALIVAAIATRAVGEHGLGAVARKVAQATEEVKS